MFDFVHERRRLVQIVLVLITLPFAFFGMESYRHSGDTDAPATVNGTKISKQDFENALRQQQDKMKQTLGASYDPAMFESAEVKRAILENMISERLLIDRAKSAGLTVTDAQIAQLIGSIDAFKQDGKFDQARYVSALASQNMSPLMFEARIKEELLAQQLRNFYLQNGYASNTATENIIAINEQQRMVSVAKLSWQNYLDKVAVDDAEVKTYYDQNQKEFQLPEQVRVEYVKFSIKDLMAKADVKDEDVKKYYSERQSEFGTAEQRQAAHILILVKAGASQAEQDAAKTHAELLLKQVQQDPTHFAELAKQNSQDPGSAMNGGDLGMFGRGMMDKAFEDATFALKQGEISGLVKSEFGYHIIKLVAIQPSKVMPFDEVRETIFNKLRQQKAADSFAELAEKFSNTVYEQSDTLKPAAELTGVQVEQSPWLVKGAAASELWTPKVLEAVFSDDAVKNKRNTAAIEVAPNTLLAAHVLEHKPAATRPYSEVQNLIKQQISHKKALDMAEKQGRMLLAQLQQGNKSVIDWSPAQAVTHAKHDGLDVEIVRNIFQANPAKLPQYVGAESRQEGFVLVRVDAIKEGDKPDDEKRAKYVQQLHKMTGDEMFQDYLKEVREQAKIKVNLKASATENP